MKRHPRSSVLFAMACLVVSGCNGGKLTRDKALSLLKEREKEKDFQAAAAQEFTMRTDIWVPQAAIENQQQRLAIKNFYDALQREGFLRSPASRPIILAYDAGTEFSYFPIEGPDIDTHPNLEGRVDARLTVVVARRRFAEVTGLTGEGETCQAEVRIEANPTETFKRVNRIYEQQRASLGDPFIQGWLASSSGPWPSEESLHVSKTVTVPFQKYDDGWRIAGMAAGKTSSLDNRELDQPDSTMAHLEAVVRASPTLELVASDRAKRTLTIRNKASNEVVTVTADDIMKGRVKLKF